MSQKAANPLVKLRADDVFELARLAMRFVIVNAKRVFEKSLSEAMTPYDIAGTILAAVGQQNLVVCNLNQPQIFHARQCTDRIHSARECEYARRQLPCLLRRKPRSAQASGRK